MPKFKNGDVVVPKKVKFPLSTKTHRKYSYTDLMRMLMEEGRPIKVSYSGLEQIHAGNFNWHPDDLELYHLDLENK